MPSTNPIAALIFKYLTQEISESELKELENWFKQSEENQKLFEQLTDAAYLSDRLKSLDNVDKEKGLKKLIQRVEDPEPDIPHKIFFKEKMLLAAAILVLSISLVQFFLLKNEKLLRVRDMPPRYNIDSGTRPQLKWNDGTIVLLDTCKNGFLKQEGNTQVFFQDGTVLYKDLPGAASQSDVFQNQLITCRETRYQVQLPDGSKVWLNAGSSIKFPVSFANSKRAVQITGEGYFEVQPHTAVPFAVDVSDKAGRSTRVEVLGTIFNINAYDDEECITTTLLKGKVQVSSGSDCVLLKRGEQCQITGKGRIKVIPLTDISEVVDWKDGFFVFNDTPVETALREIGRWYNLQIEFKGQITGSITTGAPRARPVEELLEILESKLHIHCIRKGNTIIVMK